MVRWVHNALQRSASFKASEQGRTNRLSATLFYSPTCVPRFCLKNPSGDVFVERFSKMGMLNTERNSRMNLRLEDSPEEISSHDHSTFRNPFIEGQMWVDGSTQQLRRKT